MHLPLIRTSLIPRPNYYVKALNGEYNSWAFCEERAPLYKGQWRARVFAQPETVHLDLEIGTGNGTHFAHHALTHPDRLVIGLEIKFKPLIQSIRRALRGGAENARIVRYHASALPDLFSEGELNDIFIHFPDPWPKRRHSKHRLLRQSFLEEAFKLQRPGSWIDFKTDSRDYFDFALAEFKNSPYRLTGISYDLHGSEYKETNFVTQFENVFLREGLPIHFLRAQKA